MRYLWGQSARFGQGQQWTFLCNSKSVRIWIVGKNIRGTDFICIRYSKVLPYIRMRRITGI